MLDMNRVLLKMLFVPVLVLRFPYWHKKQQILKMYLL